MWNPLPQDVMNTVRRDVSRREHQRWEHCVEAVEQYRELTDDYDGQGAVAPAAETIGGAISLIHDLIAANVAVPAYVVPGPNGSVNFDWEYGEDVSVSIEVCDAGHAEVILQDAGSRHWPLTRVVEEVAR